MTEKDKTKKAQKLKQEQKIVKEKKEHFATIKARNLPISYKQSVEIARFVRGKNLNKVKNSLKNVVDKKVAVPFKRFNRDMGHKPGKIAAGRYPITAAKNFLSLLNSVEANAENKGLNVESLILSEVIANKGANQWHFGRMRRRKMKRTNIDIKVEEVIK